MREMISSRKAPRSDQARTNIVLKELRRLNVRLAQNDSRLAHKKERPTWYEKLHDWVVKFTKYVGIPGLIIASIGPVQKLGQDILDSYNKRHIQETYLNYATVLLNQGAIDRANKLLTTLESQKDYDPKLQYYKAKTLVAMAIQQGRNYTEALDTAHILTSIQETATWGFPSFGGVDELLELRLAIIDILIAQQNYSEARAELDRLSNNGTLSRSGLFKAGSELRFGTIDVLEYKLESAKKYLSSAATNAKASSQKVVAAHSIFQLAKAYQFSYEPGKALELYGEAESAYRAIDDQFGLLRTYNNIAMIYFDRFENDKARKYQNQQQVLARKLGDELGYARATNSLAYLEKRERNYEGAIRLSLEAFGVFKQQANLLGMGSAAATLSNSYDALGNTAEAVAYAKQLLSIGLQLRELRMIGTGCGSLANVYNKTGDNGEAVFSSLCAASIIKYLKSEEIPSTKRDYEIFIAAIASVKSQVDPPEFARLLEAANKRMGEIIVSLNLEKAILNGEVAKFQSRPPPQ